MRLPFSPYSMKELVTFGGALLLLTVVTWLYVSPVAALVPLVLCLWVISFFRDPHRAIPPDRGDLVSPADGTVADISEVDAPEFPGCRAVRIGIFLSIFNVHLNRAPCAGCVETIRYKRGRFHDARNPMAGKENEALTLSLFSAEHGLRVVVRQIAGAIARRIVCRLEPGAVVGRGDRYGMIKFGSRTELILPADRVEEILVDPGSRVRAGSTVLAKIKKQGEMPGDPARSGRER